MILDDLDAAMGVLTERQKTILRCRFVQKLTLEETGRRVLGETGKPLTRERVRTIQNDALRKLRREMTRLTFVSQIAHEIGK